jgi:lysozyme
MQYERLLENLRSDEGFRALPYQDHLGRWTIGYGSTYIGIERVTASTPEVSYQAALSMLMAGAYSACIDAQGIFTNFDDLDDVRQEVLVNMAYNLGGTGLSRFVRMRTAIEQGDFNGAAAEMTESRWFQQVGDRAVRLRERMLHGHSVDPSTPAATG